MHKRHGFSMQDDNVPHPLEEYWQSLLVIPLGAFPLTHRVPSPLPPSWSHDAAQMGWGNQGDDSDMFGMWMEELGEEQSSDMDDVSPCKPL